MIGELYFGNAFGFLATGKDYGDWIGSLDLLLPFLCATAVAPSYIRPLILASSLVVPGSLKALKAIDNIGVSARRCVAERFDKTSKDEESRRTDILEQLYDIHEEKGEKVDFQLGDIQQEAYVALLVYHIVCSWFRDVLTSPSRFAGSDTTAIGFRSVLYHLMKTPEAYKQLLEELDDAAERGELSSPVKYAEAIKLPYLCACIKEALRVHPGVALTMARIVPLEGLELCGTYIPAGYRVGMNGAVIHYDKSVFGDDADQYRPGRWLEGDISKMDKCMLHFGAGTRTCIGKNISIAEIHKLIPYLLKTFHVELWEPEKTWKTTNSWFNKQEGLEVRVTARGSK